MVKNIFFFLLAFLVPAACLILQSVAKCDKVLVIVLLCLTIGVNGLHFSGVTCNHMDIAPRFAGTLMGLTNSAANLMGVIAPRIVGHIIDGHVSNFIFCKVRIF